MPLDLEEVRRMPMLDAREVLVFSGVSADVKGAKREDPCGCVFARTCHRADFEAVVLRTVTWLVQEVDKPLLLHNRDLHGPERVKGITPGQIVRVRYRNDDRLIHQIRLWDDENRQFIPGEFALLPFMAKPILNEVQAVVVRRAREMVRRPSVYVDRKPTSRARMQAVRDA